MGGGESRSGRCPGAASIRCCWENGAKPPAAPLEPGAMRVGPLDGACIDEDYDEISIGAVGDILPHDKIQIAAYEKQSFLRLFEDTVPILQNADILYGNLECNVAGPITYSKREVDIPEDRPFYDGQAYSGYPKFNAANILLRDLKEAGFDVLSTANNHALDRRAIGVDRTIANLKKFGLQWTGTISSEDTDAKWYTIVEKHGKNRDGSRADKPFRVAFVGCTFSTNGLEDGKDQVLFCYDRLGKAHRTVLDLVASLKARSDVDAVVVTPHWGDKEKRLDVDPKEQAAGRAFIDAGASVVFGTHVHVPQPAENYKEGIICYGSSNFLSKYSSFPARLSMFFLAGLRRIKSTGKVVAAGYQWHPFEQQKSGKLSAVKEFSWTWLHKTFGRERLLASGERADLSKYDRSKCGQ